MTPNTSPSAALRAGRAARRAVLVLLLFVGLLLAGAAGASAAGPTAPVAPVAPSASGGGVTVAVNGLDGTPSSTVTLILAVTLLSVAPALLVMTTAFTKIIVVLSITRNALGLPSAPPNQVLAGLALFLSLFVMAPVLSEINTVAVQPYLHGALTQTDAFELGVKPLRAFMLHQTRGQDLALITRAAHRANPANPDSVPLLTLIPAFVLSELRAAFIIGFVILIPFLVIDIVVSSALMAMGMAMLPPVTVSLPFKILMFVLVNGWGLVITALVGSYRVAMDDSAVLDVALQALIIAAKLSAPFLLAALVIGFTVSLFQSVTQIQEATLSFVPKALGVALVMLFAGHWMITQMTDFVTELFARIPDLLSGG